MTRRERMLGALTMLVVLLAGVLSLFSPRPPARQPAVAAVAQTRAAPPRGPDPRPAPAIAPGEQFDLDVLRAMLLEPVSARLASGPRRIHDPFIPLVTRGSGLADSMLLPSVASSVDTSGASMPRLEGIVISGQQRTALVDGRHLDTGAALQDLLVEEIRPDMVILVKGRRRFALSFTGLEPLK